MNIAGYFFSKRFSFVYGTIIAKYEINSKGIFWYVLNYFLTVDQGLDGLSHDNGICSPLLSQSVPQAGGYK